MPPTITRALHVAFEIDHESPDTNVRVIFQDPIPPFDVRVFHANVDAVGRFNFSPRETEELLHFFEKVS